MSTVHNFVEDWIEMRSKLQRQLKALESKEVSEVSIAVAGGGKVARLQNANGVVMDLQGTQAGFEASLSLSGMTVSLR
jgi:hypothetical protein